MFIALTIFTTISNLFLGLITFYKNPKSSTNRFFFLLTIILALWSCSNYYSLANTTPTSILFWIRVVMAITAWMFHVLFLLANAFPSHKLNLPPLAKIIMPVYTLFVSIISLTPLVFRDIIVTGSSTQPLPGNGIAFYALNLFFFLIATLVTLVRKYRRSTGVEKTQVQIFLIGISCTFILATLTNFVIVNLLRNTSFVALGPSFSLILVFSIYYTIIRHRFLDINIIIGRTIVYTLVILFITLIYTLGFFALGQRLFNLHLNFIQQFILIIITLVIAFSFHLIQRFVQNITDHFLFQGNYSTDTVLSTLSQIMASTIRLEDLAHNTLQVVTHQLRITHAAFILLNDSKIGDVLSDGYSQAPLFNEDDIHLLSSTRNTVVFDELDESDLKKILRNLDISIVVHLRTKGNQIGLLILGPKQSGNIYSNQDLSFLEILAPQAAVAIQNSQAYEEIRRFNITLQEEVDKATTDLKSANEKLEILDKLKDEFVSVASHELRTPMTAIKSYTWMVLNGKAGDINPKTKDYLDRVYQSTDRLIHLVNEMLDVSRIEGGRVTLKFEPVDMTKLAVDVQNEFSARSTETGLTITVQPLPNQPSVTADREKIHQILENLVGNSFKFTPKGGHVTIAFKINSGFLETSVADDGPGIAPDDLPRLFKKFGRLENSLIALANNSTGLGLFISKQYVELHHGRIWVDSQLGHGAIFTFSLPLS